MKGNRLVLFTNSYPYGPGETFLHEELPFVAAKFSEVIIYPLYIPHNSHLNSFPVALPDNVIVKQALLPFDHKDKKHLLLRGVFNFAPLFFSLTEFLSIRVLESWKNTWIFFNYLLMLRAVLGNGKLIREIEKDLVPDLFNVSEPGGDELEGGNLNGEGVDGEKKENPSGVGERVVAYFYWGDKSALIIPFLKKRLLKRCYSRACCKDKALVPMPEFVVRFHGSDLYEQAKGYLPFRKMLYTSIDYAVTISQSGADYIKQNYSSSLPDNICVYRLGSCNPYFNIDTNTIVTETDKRQISPQILENVHKREKTFRIVSCSNVIGLKRVHLIAQALKEFGKELELVLELAELGIESITWTHIGNGPLLEKIKKECEGMPSFIKTEFLGAMPHNKVLEFYHTTGANLFVQASRSEGVPVAIMEALSFGIPVVATNVGGVNEIVSESYGTLMPANLTPTILKQAFIYYMQMPVEEYEKMRSNAIGQWQSSWNAKVNYEKFSDFISGLARL